ncbi:hypothetical protein ABG067_006584, partial [Albugo candida]
MSLLLCMQLSEQDSKNKIWQMIDFYNAKSDTIGWSTLKVGVSLEAMKNMELKELVLDQGNGNVVESMLQDLVRSRPDLILVEGCNAVLYAGYEETRDQQVVILSGGMTGREPVHALYVGYGKLTGAVCGELLASPSSQQIFKAIQVITGSKGCLVILKNNVGDSMNFGIAIEQAKCSGYKVQMIVYGKESYQTNMGKEDVRDRDLVYLHQLASVLAKDGHTLEFIVDAVTFLIRRRKYGVGVMDIPRHLKDPVAGFVAGGYDSSFAAAFLLNRHFQSKRKMVDLQLVHGGIHVPFVSSSAAIVDRISYYMALFNKEGSYMCSSQNENKVWARNQLKRLSFHERSRAGYQSGEISKKAYYDTTLAHECNKWKGFSLQEQCERLHFTKVRLSLDGKMLLACYENNLEQAFHIDEKDSGDLELVPLRSDFIASRQWRTTTFTQEICGSNLENLRTYLLAYARSQSDVSTWMEVEGSSSLWYYLLDDVRPKTYETYTQGVQLRTCVSTCETETSIDESTKVDDSLTQNEKCDENELKFVLIENYFTPTKCDTTSLVMLEPEMEPEAIGLENQPSTSTEEKGKEECVDQPLATEKVSASWTLKALQDIERNSRHIRSCEVGSASRYYNQADRHSQWVLILNEFLKTQVAWKSGAEDLPIKKRQSRRQLLLSGTQSSGQVVGEESKHRLKTPSRANQHGGSAMQHRELESSDAITADQKHKSLSKKRTQSMEQVELPENDHLMAHAKTDRKSLKSVQVELTREFDHAPNSPESKTANILPMRDHQKGTELPLPTKLHQNVVNSKPSSIGDGIDKGESDWKSECLESSAKTMGRIAPSSESSTTTELKQVESDSENAQREFTNQPEVSQYGDSHHSAKVGSLAEDGWNVYHTRNCKCKKRKSPKDIDRWAAKHYDKVDSSSFTRSSISSIAKNDRYDKHTSVKPKHGKQSWNATAFKALAYESDEDDDSIIQN